MTIPYTGEVRTIGQTRDVLAAITTAAWRLIARVSTLLDEVVDADLDAQTIATIEQIRDGADAVAVAADKTTRGLNARHAVMEEALNTAAARADASAESPAPVSFADLDREQRIEAMRAEIDTAMERLIDPDCWTRFLDAAATFHRYTTSNIIIAISQKPDASLLAGFKDWKNKHGRTVRKGEKAIWIYAPITYTVTETDPDTGEKNKIQHVKGFRPVPVFDVSQTDGEPIPQPPQTPIAPLDGEAPAGVLEHLTTQITGRGYTVHHEPLEGHRDGYTDFQTRRVVIDQAGAQRHQALVLAHELAHIALGHADHRRDYHTGAAGRRPEMEIEAESVAYVLARHHGIPDPGRASFGYIAGWAKGDKGKVRATADRVLATVRALIGTKS